MSSVDDRIVNMQWNSKQFTQGAADSQRALEGVDRALANTGKGAGLATMGNQVDGISGKFNAMRVAGITALATIASKATSAGLNVVKGLTIDPIMQGFQEYQTNLNSIQTIMANTGKGVNVVNQYLNDLNHYSDQTIYNFSQMADSIGKFTAAGVPLKEATSSIKGMANMAALSGSNVQQLNTAMYQMSQALSTGTIRLMDWNSLANAGMGGSNIREALMATNRTLGDHGVAMDAAIKKAGSFRDSLQAGWLTADTFNKTMKVMAGQTIQNSDDLKKLGMTQNEFEKSGHKMGDTIAFTTEQLQKMGYSKEAAKRLSELSASAIDSATKVKTASQALDVVKESIGSGFAKIFQDLFGNFNEATKLWTNVTNSITTAVGRVFGAVDNMLVGWRNLGGYQDLWTGFGNIFKTIGNLISPFVTAFKTLLPTTGKAGSTLAGATSAFATFTGWMEKASEKASLLTPILVSVFSVFGKIGSVIGAVIHGLAPLAPLLSDISSAFSHMAEQGSGIASGLISGLVSGLNPSAIRQAVTNFANSIVDWAKSALGIHSPSTKFIEIGYNIISGLILGIIHGVTAVGPAIGKAISVIFEHFTGLFEGFDAMDWTGLFNAILTGGLIYALKKSVDAVTSFRDLMGSMKGVIDGVGDSLEAWQHSLKAKMILEIAIAIGILSASIIALSFVDPKKIAIGLGAITTLLADVSGTLLALSKIGESKQSIGVLATSLLLISAAMINFASAVLILGKQDLDTLAKGIGSIAIIMGILVASMAGFAKIKGSVEGMAASMLVIALAMNVLAAAVLAFGSMDMKTLAKGLGSIAIGLGLFVAAMLGMDKMKGSPEGLAASILVMSAAMVVLATAVAMFGNMDMGTLAKGFGAVTLALGLFVGALLLLSGNSAGVVAAAGAMVLMATAMNLMLGVILALGAAPWQVVAKGLGFVALALAIFLAAAAAAILVAPGLEVLGTSIALIGAAMFLAGAGMLAFATGWALMAASGVAGTAVIIAAIHAFLALLPEIARQMAASLIAFLKVIANSTSEIREAFDKIFRNILGVISDNIPVVVALVVKFVNELLKGVRKIIPEFGKTISQLIKTGLDVITKAVPRYIDAGVTIVTKVLEGMANKMPKMLDAAGDLIVKFIEGLGKQAGKIVDAAGRTILKFLQAVDAAIQKYESRIIAEGVQIAKHLAEGLVQGLSSVDVKGMIGNAVKNFGGSVVGGLKGALHIGSPSKDTIPLGVSVGMGVAVGIAKSRLDVIKEVVKMANAIIAAGNDQVAKAQKQASALQTKAYRAQAQADLKADQAKDAARFARQHKKNKEAQKRASQLKKQADQAQKKADQAQTQADKAAQNVQDVQTFEQADLHGKGDIKNDLAVQLSDRANQVMQKANAEAARARQLMETNRKAGRAMLEQAKKDAQRAKELAKRAEKAHKDANKFYAQEVNDRIKQMEADAAADEQARKDQEAYDAADAQGKSDILTKRAEANEAKAAALKAQAAALLDQAKKLANTDAAKAMKLLDQAQQAADDAQAAADQAADERQQAEQVLNQDSSSASGGSSPGVIQPSKSILEDAASAVDRYTASLLEAQQLAGAQQGPIQFVQNNYSPEPLPAGEIYRQGKNLVSLAEIKMGDNSKP
jgi:hypothetical protein